MYPHNGRFHLRQNMRIYSDVFRMLDEVEVRRIQNLEDLEDVFRLRYRAYGSKGFIEYRADGQCFDHFDGLDNTYLFGFYDAGRLISSIRVHLLDRDHRESPSTMVFGDVLDDRIAAGVTFIDSSRFTIDPLFSRSEHRLLHFVTMRIPVLACVYFDTDFSLSLVRPSHAAFYRRYFDFRDWGDVRHYPEINFPVTLLAANTKQVAEKVFRRLPFMNSLPAERRLLFDADSARRCCSTIRSTAGLVVESMLRDRQPAANDNLVFA